jgi:hypothetical protein
VDTHNEDDKEDKDGMMPKNLLVFTPRSLEGVFWDEKQHAKSKEKNVEEC